VICLAYKRYIHRNGKKHGPYYYKNIRDENGNVKSIYLGKKRGIHHIVRDKGKSPFKLTIAVLFILLILISALFFVQNRNLVLSKKAVEESATPFEVDQILIKVLVKTGDSLVKEIRIMNAGNKEETIKVEALGLLDIVKITDNEFTIKPGQTKIVEIELSSFDEKKNIEHTPGVYIGKITAKTEDFEKDIPVIVEIETKDILFDSNLNPISRDRTILQGQAMTIEVRLFNLQSIEPTNIDVEYFVKDLNGNTIISEKESVVVETQASFFKTLKIPQNLRVGSYIFATQASYGNSVGTSSYLFEVISLEEKPIIGFIPLDFIQFCRQDPLCWTLSLIILLLIFTIGAYLYFFLGAYLYNRLFSGKQLFKRKTEVSQEVVVENENESLELQLKQQKDIFEVKERKKEGEIKKFFRIMRANRTRREQEKYRRKLRREREKLRLQTEKQRWKLKLKEEKEKLKQIEFESKRKEQGQREREKIRKLLEKTRLMALRKKKIHEFFSKSPTTKKVEKGKKGKLKLKADGDRRRLQLEKEKMKQIELRNKEREKIQKRIYDEEKIKEKPKKNKKKAEIKEKSKKKESKLVKKYNDLIGKCDKSFESGNINKAKVLYSKAVKVYIHMDYEEKKDIYKKLMGTYNKLNK